MSDKTIEILRRFADELQHYYPMPLTIDVVVRALREALGDD